MLQSYLKIALVIASLVALCAADDDFGELEECIQTSAPSLHEIPVDDDMLEAKKIVSEEESLRETQAMVEESFSPEQLEQMRVKCESFLAQYNAIAKMNKCLSHVYDSAENRSYIKQQHPFLELLLDIHLGCFTITLFD